MSIWEPAAHHRKLASARFRGVMGNIGLGLLLVCAAIASEWMSAAAVGLGTEAICGTTFMVTVLVAAVSTYAWWPPIPVGRAVLAGAMVVIPMLLLRGYLLLPGSAAGVFLVLVAGFGAFLACMLVDTLNQNGTILLTAAAVLSLDLAVALLAMISGYGVLVGTVLIGLVCGSATGLGIAVARLLPVRAAHGPGRTHPLAPGLAFRAGPRWHPPRTGRT